ncbi:D-alanyl-D-alanine carboxypeptidase/D-alanyl-D-alanine-endopeptidase [Agromyces cerinus subsp. nitratus]|uniref:D-alanyl-D-alanine carboxypeptidase/D-alanyl-D-alanine-endopeptidase n=1 Tax=Agromyces cerinus TaxID=33878 RepID=UPI001EF92A37
MTAETRVEATRTTASGADPRLGSARIHVIDVADGRVVFDRDGDLPGPTASVLKLLTSAAALAALGPDHRIATRVVAGAEPGEIVLVGGGDVTLTRLPVGTASFYRSSAHLETLADDVLAAIGDGVVDRLVLDDSLFAGEAWLPEWDVEGRSPEGYIPFITALQVDGDRDDPTIDDTPRSEDPVGRVGTAFAELIGRGRDIRVSSGRAAPDAAVLAEVFSPPLSELIRFGLETSDNALMESLARLSALAIGESADFAGVSRAMPALLARYGLPVEGLTIRDGSGLSERNSVPARFVAELLVRAHRREQGLGVIDDMLPATGPDGTFNRKRFTGDDAIVGDAVRAKTGYINIVCSLGGVVRAADGTELAFAVYAVGEMMGDPARAAIDAFVASLYLDGADAA